MGIVNGTTNFILSKMTSEGSDYADALKRGPGARLRRGGPDGRRRGASTPPRRCRSSRRWPSAPNSCGEEISREGITGVRSIDVEFARRAGYVIKLLGVAERVGERRHLASRAPDDGPRRPSARRRCTAP